MLNYNINTPILFIVFKYPLTMQQVFEKIMYAKPKKLYIATYATFIKDRFVKLSKQNKNMKIPRIIHQIYEAPAGTGESLLELAKTWVEHHPTWEYRFPLRLSCV